MVLYGSDDTSGSCIQSTINSCMYNTSDTMSQLNSVHKVSTSDALGSESHHTHAIQRSESHHTHAIQKSCSNVSSKEIMKQESLLKTHPSSHSLHRFLSQQIHTSWQNTRQQYSENKITSTNITESTEEQNHTISPSTMDSDDSTSTSSSDDEQADDLNEKQHPLLKRLFKCCRKLSLEKYVRYDKCETMTQGDSLHPGRAHPRILERIQSITGLRPQDLFIDIGSGDGFVVLGLAAVTGCHSIGVEVVKSRYEDSVRLGHTFLHHLSHILHTSKPTISDTHHHESSQHKSSKHKSSKHKSSQHKSSKHESSKHKSSKHKSSQHEPSLYECTQCEQMNAKDSFFGQNESATSHFQRILTSLHASWNGYAIYEDKTTKTKIETTNCRKSPYQEQKPLGYITSKQCKANPAKNPAISVYHPLIHNTLAHKLFNGIPNRSIVPYGDNTISFGKQTPQKMYMPDRNGQYKIQLRPEDSTICENKSNLTQKQTSDTHFSRSEPVRSPLGDLSIQERVQLVLGDVMNDSIDHGLSPTALGHARVVFCNNFDGKWLADRFQERILLKCTRFMCEGSILISCYPMIRCARRSAFTSVLIHHFQCLNDTGGHDTFTNSNLYFCVHGGWKQQSLLRYKNKSELADWLWKQKVETSNVYDSLHNTIESLKQSGYSVDDELSSNVLSAQLNSDASDCLLLVQLALQCMNYDASRFKQGKKKRFSRKYTFFTSSNTPERTTSASLDQSKCGHQHRCDSPEKERDLVNLAALIVQNIWEDGSKTETYQELFRSVEMHANWPKMRHKLPYYQTQDMVETNSDTLDQSSDIKNQDLLKASAYSCLATPQASPRNNVNQVESFKPTTPTLDDRHSKRHCLFKSNEHLDSQNETKIGRYAKTQMQTQLSETDTHVAYPKRNNGIDSSTKSLNQPRQTSLNFETEYHLTPIRSFESFHARANLMHAHNSSCVRQPRSGSIERCTSLVTPSISRSQSSLGLLRGAVRRNMGTMHGVSFMQRAATGVLHQTRSSRKRARVEPIYGYEVWN